MDIKLNYTDSGSGDVLVLLHGNGEDHTYFDNQIMAFSKSHRVIAVDTRGHGASPRGTAPFTLHQFADDLKTFLQDMDIQKCTLLGFSDGGNIALLFALKYPEYIDKLILYSANLWPSGIRITIRIPDALIWTLLWPVKFFSRRVRAKWYMLNLMVTQPRIDIDNLESINVPTLIIAGDRDMIYHGHTCKIASSIQGSRLAIISGSHFVSRECPIRFNQVILGFLGEQHSDEL